MFENANVEVRCLLVAASVQCTAFFVTALAANVFTVGTASATNSPTLWAATADNNGSFAIGNSGVITTSAAVSSNEQVSLTVTATDAGGRSLGVAVGGSFRALASGTTFYISSSIGNDSNNCLSPSTACQTIGKANTLSYPAGSTLGFLAGDTIPVPTPLSLSPSNVHGALTITSYGSGTCNVLAKDFTGCATLQAVGVDNDAIDIYGLSNVTVQNLRLLGGTNNAVFLFQRGAGVRYDGANDSLSNFTVRNIEASEFATGIYLQSSRLNGGTILNNWVHGASATSAMDTGVWVRFGQTNILIQGNVVENIGGKPQSVAGVYPGGTGNGILIADGASHVLDQFNVTRFNGANTTTCGGPSGNWTFNSSYVTIQFNESYGNAPISYLSGCDWSGFDLDGGTRNSVLQYNYAHDNYGAGFLSYMVAVGGNNWQNNVIRYNISVNDSANQNQGSFSFNGSGDSGSAVFNNTAYNHSRRSYSYSSGLCSNSFGASATRFLNNICYNDNADTFTYSTTGASLAADGNDYFRTGTAPPYPFQYSGKTYSTFGAYQSGSGQDTNGITSNPRLAATPSLPSTTCYVDGTVPGPLGNCPRGYRLQAGSSLIGVGLAITGVTLGVGSRDYFGNEIPNGVGTGFNVGADGGNP
jgi:hypothetical protein